MWCHRQWIITSIEEYMEIAPNVMLLDFFFFFNMAETTEKTPYYREQIFTAKRPK